MKVAAAAALSSSQNLIIRLQTSCNLCAVFYPRSMFLMCIGVNPDVNSAVDNDARCHCTVIEYHYQTLNIAVWALWSHLQVTFSKAAFTLTLVPVLVPVRLIRTGEVYTSGAFTLTYNSVAIKNLVKIVNYLEFLAKVYYTIVGNVCSCLHQHSIISLLCAALINNK